LIIFLVKGRLRSEFASKELGSVGRRTREGTGNIGHVGDDGFDAVAFAFDLSHKDRHAVAATC
jgi:hypothetical protein